MPAVPDFSAPAVLRTEADYYAAVAEIDAGLDDNPVEGSEAYDRLELLSVLVEAYEAQHYPLRVEEVSSQGIVDFMLEQTGLNRTALYDAMGGKTAVSEFFAGERELSSGQTAALRHLLGIPANLLL